MSSIGRLLFCTACGTLLPETGPHKKAYICSNCGTKNKNVSANIATQHSKPRAFRSDLRTKNSEVADVGDDEMQREQKIEKECPKCGRGEMKYYTLQLRSVDEGSTVFYTCEGCGWKENTNN